MSDERLPRQGFFGVGPALVLTGGAGFAAVYALGRCAGMAVPLCGAWRTAGAAAGSVMLAGGLVLWFFAVRRIMRGIPAGCLMTDGVYALCRNPLYAAFILLIVPGAGLLTGNILYLAVPVIMYVVFRRVIVREEVVLLGLFGARYQRYCQTTPRLFPRLRR